MSLSRADIGNGDGFDIGGDRSVAQHALRCLDVLRVRGIVVEGPLDVMKPALDGGMALRLKPAENRRKLQPARPVSCEAVVREA